MNEIDRYISEIQAGHMQNLLKLMECFQPLIISWLKKIHQWHTSEQDDYQSTAKLILLECAKKFDKNKNVPFQSYYKLCLYHWYGNWMQKKKIQCIHLSEALKTTYCTVEQEPLQIQFILEQLNLLTEQEKIILQGLINGEDAMVIAKKLGLSKKTILNKKYILMKKIKEVLK